ncbi:activating signal cointegrator 1 complex subunit [Dimargaris cristalligena]|uniref:AKAP7 2'5' RNA ligase-like domain-containing protein n=1 Tax=Dimargaris cristalligena TaxID=215637 RepID=A0A4P9ZXH8_9FUNG|nr:activating signal cointegrator 1 complex subunit [Dimargaris cristalligena]RKP38363.1 AKAP7 2'5' RNA ligase-like domain-containing protein [Dimargaris cristalligena]|eukprot:RKP38363.1 AKAP7 2'5' RNA ligase-like domain-containing protein [Dimargaris cristalligena]
MNHIKLLTVQGRTYRVFSPPTNPPAPRKPRALFRTETDTDSPLCSAGPSESSAGPSAISNDRTELQPADRKSPSRASGPFTHFISLPLKERALQDKVRLFREAALNCYRNSPAVATELVDPADPNLGPLELNPRLYMRSERVHLTIGMLRLSSPEEMEQASETLRSCSATIYDLLGTRSLVIQLEGLRIMKGTPDHCKVLYAAVKDDSENRLKQVCQHLLTTFKNAGFLVSDDIVELKLHATLANTTFLPRSVANSRKISVGQLDFNARPILDQLGDYNFGTTRIGRIQIAKCASFDPDDGSYISICDVLLP